MGRRWRCDGRGVCHGGGDGYGNGISDRGKSMYTIYFTPLHSPLQCIPAMTYSSSSQLPLGEHIYPHFIIDDNEPQTGHILLAQGRKASKLAQALCL